MVGSNASSFTQSSPESQDAIQMRAGQMQQIISDATASRIMNDSTIQRLQEIRVNDREKMGGESSGGSRDHESSPVQSSGERGERIEKSHRESNAADELAWAIVKQKLASLRQPRIQSANEELFLEDLAKILGWSSEDKATTGIPQSILAAAPHLATILPTSQDSHLAEMFHLHQLNPILDLMQQQGLQVPLPRSIWKDILLDQYVNYEKLFASMELGYDHDDEPKDLAAGFTIIKKDHSSSRHPIRIYGAWADGYRTIILKLFHSMSSDPDAYHKSPFHLDNRARLQVHIFSEIMRSSSHSALGKRSSCAATPCINWNLERCNDDDDHCANQRKHGVCCECRGQHQVKDDSACYATFKAQKEKGSGESSRGGSSSSART
ncbi:uncharacterized protein LAESUDRAFT_738656 [Laetiporus sulphureus 93-53]|uniref:Uncharacterized protein n=1 Tax=Laetiporus sulphureus 93-53 TaxID=1314785 RepID=A0A165CCG6_9APHY|nr:uncharacterized protein LAESUDRAFT_738656 [Laetiporus sulphureus 93-53]KZT02560.1 hypothetical protein LAESUDRAFT_738656 [Laetiporus sulphureus 93-53]